MGVLDVIGEEVATYGSGTIRHKQEAHLRIAKAFLESELTERKEYLAECFRNKVKYNPVTLAAMDMEIAMSRKAVKDCEEVLK